MSSIGSIYISVGIFIISFIIYINTISCGFVFDDYSAITNNKDLEDSSPWSNLIWNDYWGTPMQSERSHKSYRPLTVLTFKLNNLFFGREAWSFHLVNIFLNAAVSVLYYRLCIVICSTCLKHDVTKKNIQKTNVHNSRTIADHSLNIKLQDETWRNIAYIATALFVVHPVHTEAVSSIVGRAELLCAIFMILTFLSYVRFKTQHMLMAIVFFICAVASKEQGITVLAVCIVFDFFVAHRLSPLEFLFLRKTSNIYVGLRSAIVSFVACVVLYWRFTLMKDILPSFMSFDNPASSSETPTRQLTYNYLLVVNALILLNPSHLLCDWSMGTIPLIKNFTDIRILVIIIFWVLLLLLSWIAISKKDSGSKVTLMGLALLISPFLPASNLFFPVGFVIAERILYLPSMGYCLLVSLGLVKLKNFFRIRKYAFLCAFTVLCACFTSKTILRNSEWKSDYTLFQSGLQFTKNNAKLWNNVAYSIEEEKPETALLYYTEAAKTQPDDIGSHVNMGRVQKRLGFFREAEMAYRKAKELFPKRVLGKKIEARIAPADLQLYVHLGNLLKANKSRWAEVDELYKEALSMRNDFTDGYINRGEILMLMGKYEEAVDCYKKALEHADHKDDMYFNLGVVHSQMGNVTGAVEYYTYAIQVNPYHIKSLYNSAVIFEETGKKDLIKRAKIRVERILEIEPDNYLALSLLGSIYLDNEDEKTAKKFWMKVLAIHPDDKSALYNMAFMYSKKDEVEESIKYIELLLNYHPTHIKGLTLYGQILLNKKKDTKAAAEAFSRIVEVDPKNIQAQHNFCVCILEEGRLFDAENCMHQVYLMAPEAKYVADNLAIIRKHIAKQKKDNAGEALDFADHKNPMSDQSTPKPGEIILEEKEEEEEELVFIEQKREKVREKTISEKAKLVVNGAKNAAKLIKNKKGDDKLKHVENALKKAHDAVKQLNEMNDKVNEDKEQKCAKLPEENVEQSHKNKQDLEDKDSLKMRALNYLDELEAELL